MRRSGRTTRLVDWAIQQLFSGNTVTIADHHESFDNQKRLVKLVANRLQNEHNVRASDLDYDYNENTLKLKNLN